MLYYANSTYSIVIMLAGIGVGREGVRGSIRTDVINLSLIMVLKVMIFIFVCINFTVKVSLLNLTICKFSFAEFLKLFFSCYSDTLRGLNFLLICKTTTTLWICGALVACLLEWCEFQPLELYFF